MVGTNPDASKKPACGTSSATDYALVTFGAPAQYHYAAVAGNGTWTLLNSRSMVHYVGTPDPGQQGNVIIAFHREPDFQYINQLNVGDLDHDRDAARARPTSTGSAAAGISRPAASPSLRRPAATS